MPTDAIEQRLRELHAPRVEPPRASASAEQRALACWAARYEDDGHARAGSRLPAVHRLAVAIGALLMVIVGACVLPTSYDIPLGLSLEIRPAAGERLPVREIAAFVRERSDAAEVDVLMRELVRDGGEPQAELLIRLWDQELALGELELELREQFPALADAEIVETALEGEVETIWARRLAHRAFRVSLRETDVEQARQHLLIELRSRGFAEDEVVVKVRDRDDGHREVEVQIERRHLGEGEPPAIGDEPGFLWVMDPAGDRKEGVELTAPPGGKPVRIQIGGEDD